MKRRVVITGVGCVTPIGASYEEVKHSLLNGISGITYDEEHGVNVARVTIDIDSQFDSIDMNITDRFSRLAWLSYEQAQKDANIDVEGVMVGVGYGGGALALDQSYSDLARINRTRPTALVCSMPNNASNYIAHRAKIKGPVFTYSAACASSSLALGEAYRYIASGEVDTLAAGGTESCLNGLSFANWKAMGAITKNKDEPSKSCKPFSSDRKGIVLAEGSAMYILEEREHAINRGAKIYGEILGFGYSCNADSMTKPNKEGQVTAIQKILKEVDINRVSHINAHGTATPVGDMIELESIKQVFGDLTPNIPITSTKALHGHALGSSGTIETLACLVTIEHDIIIPNWNLDSCDELIPDGIYLPVRPMNKQIDVILNNSFAFGGTNIVLALAKH
jgi:3-oxoacyl-[acyl-carrier-protein] synthase II